MTQGIKHPILHWKDGVNNIVCIDHDTLEPELVGTAYVVTPAQYERAQAYESGVCMAAPLYNEDEVSVIFLGLGNVVRACGQVGLEPVGLEGGAR